MSRNRNRNRNRNQNDNNGLKWPTDQYWGSADYNERLFRMFRDQITSLAITRFKWVNLPDHCDERYLEYTLLTQGQATIAFPRRRKGRFFSTQAVYSVGPNLYDNPVKWQSYGNNGFKFNVTKANGVWIWENRLRIPITDNINIWARELVDIMRTKQINRLHQKLPYFLTGPATKEFDMQQLIKQIAGGEPYILGTQGLSEIQAQVLKTDVPYIGSDLHAEYLNIWNEIYKMLGINNLPFKVERQIEDEVESQNEPADLMALNPLECRREACKKLNDRFSNYLEKPINVVWRQDNMSDNYNIINNMKKRIELDNGTDDTGI